MTEPVAVPPLDDATVRDCLHHGTLEIDGRVLPASNATFVGEVTLGGLALRCVYKPVRGERPLWDFPAGTLAGREVAAYEVSRRAGWDVVPPTVLVDGPFGAGMLQVWVDTDEEELVDLVPEGQVPPGWRHVLDAWDHQERPVSLVHADHPALRRMVVFDAVVNNADRKAGHLLGRTVGAEHRVHGCDHGLTFHTDDKLRTVLWGWAGEPLTEDDLRPVRRLLDTLGAGGPGGSRGAGSGGSELSRLLGRLLAGDEVARLRSRSRQLVRDRCFPRRPVGWRAVPWPIF